MESFNFLNLACNDLEKKLRLIFGEEGMTTLQKEAAVPELKWVLDIATVMDCANTDPEM